MTNTLQLIFQLADEKTLTLSVAQPKANLTDAEVVAAMQTIIEQNVFMRDNVTIVAKKAARIVSRTVKEFNVL
ncbi:MULTISPECIES: DUF2922 domain-containing protein [Metasolibacillus]|uniref:DUF2922 domain-containing protein n=1 Tax=Metasolibacillus TaxID=2703677 RepID=UPI00079C2E05|nr:DUF2922 domain-containing protein [Metasolibacillus fluoroglycofenilyticus]KYG91946.1 hypothetical protein A0U40_03130 [[Bacillus] sp. KCTC 13219]